MTRRILIVDDDPGIREALSLLLEDAEEMTPLTAKGGAEALSLLAKESVSLVLCDVSMPGMDGLELLGRIKELDADQPVVMISAHGDLETAVTAVRNGAYDYLVKPIEEKRLLHTIERALEYRRLRSASEALQEELRDELVLIGRSDPMKALREQIERAAPTDARILILGENGTGKELVAKLIHDHSRRHDGPFVKLNSAAIPKELIESELFGHEAGAFTGATKAKKGKLELATGGTLFLDEIGDMAAESQAKLLRVLATSEYERVGGSRTLQFDARLLAASNRDLQAAIQHGEFREDLFHRIAVIPLRVPTLRERGRDIEILAEHFLDHFSANYGRTPPVLSDAARELLLTYSWPGNVRELRNLMERVAIMHPRADLEESELHALLQPVPGPRATPPAASTTGGGTSGAGSGRTADAAAGAGGPASVSAKSASESASLADQWKSAKREQEQEFIRTTLVEAGWNVTLAAKRLGIDRASLHRKMKRLDIERPGRENEG